MSRCAHAVPSCFPSLSGEEPVDVLKGLKGRNTYTVFSETGEKEGSRLEEAGRGHAAVSKPGGKRERRSDHGEGGLLPGQSGLEAQEPWQRDFQPRSSQRAFLRLSGTWDCLDAGAQVRELFSPQEAAEASGST